MRRELHCNPVQDLGLLVKKQFFWKRKEYNKNETNFDMLQLWE